MVGRTAFSSQGFLVLESFVPKSEAFVWSIEGRRQLLAIILFALICQSDEAYVCDLRAHRTSSHLRLSTMPPKRSGVTKRASKASSSSSASKKAAAAATTTSLQSPSDPNGPIFFWRPQEAATGYLSQWYALPFRDRADSAKIYATAEHYMMHQKALLFGDAEMAATILEAPSPRDVKALGRAVRGFDQAVWERERVRIVTEGNWCKFSLPVVEESVSDRGEGAKTEVAGGAEEGREEEEKDRSTDPRLRTWKLGNADDAVTMRAASFREVLLATGDRELVEASPRDRIWGVGFGAKGAEAKRAKWGMNLLGKCLMEVREQFRKEAEAAKDENGGES
ncbi:hypothetical protein F5Y10DRAFT_281703 [Nemania abortiva]|nr:hypothetical protein F5Y10DRAFT_281703 [Nemania abortiva]